MAYEFTYSTHNVPIKMQYNKPVAKDALDIKYLINHYFVVASYRTRYLVSRSQCSLRGTKVDLRVRSTVH
jgi:hypothetical protein